MRQTFFKWQTHRSRNTLFAPRNRNGNAPHSGHSIELHRRRSHSWGPLQWASTPAKRQRFCTVLYRSFTKRTGQNKQQQSMPSDESSGIKFGKERHSGLTTIWNDNFKTEKVEQEMRFSTRKRKSFEQGGCSYNNPNLSTTAALHIVYFQMSFPHLGKTLGVARTPTEQQTSTDGGNQSTFTLLCKPPPNRNLGLDNRSRTFFFRVFGALWDSRNISSGKDTL